MNSNRQIKGKQVLAVTVVCILGASGVANAGVTVSVHNTGSFSQQSISVLPGETFSIDITVNTTTEIFDMFDMKLLAGWANLLTVTGGSVQTPWTNPNGLPIGDVNPQSTRFDIILPNPDLFGPGESALVTLDLAIKSNAFPGTFTLNVVDGKWTACRICPAFGSAEIGSDFMIEVLRGSQVPAVSRWGAIILVLMIISVGTILAPRQRT